MSYHYQGTNYLIEEIIWLPGLCLASPRALAPAFHWGQAEQCSGQIQLAILLPAKVGSVCERRGLSLRKPPGCSEPSNPDCSPKEQDYCVGTDHPLPSNRTHSSTWHPCPPPPAVLGKVNAINTIEFSRNETYDYTFSWSKS